MGTPSDYVEFHQYCRQIGRYPLLFHDQEYELAKRYQKGDVTAGQQIIRANLRFVVKVSRKYFYTGHNCLEIIQEGNLGLIRALHRFDPDRGVPFIFYAVWWIKATIKVFLQKSGKVHTGSLEHAKGLLPLDKTIGDDDACRWVDFLTDGVHPEKHYYERERSQHISALLQHCFSFLSQREVLVITQRFFTDPPVTLKEIGMQLGVSRERVRQLQVRSMEKMKGILNDQGRQLMESESHDTPALKEIRC